MRRADEKTKKEKRKIQIQMPRPHVLANADAVGLKYPKKWKD